MPNLWNLTNTSQSFVFGAAALKVRVPGSWHWNTALTVIASSIIHCALLHEGSYYKLHQDSEATYNAPTEILQQKFDKMQQIILGHKDNHLKLAPYTGDKTSLPMYVTMCLVHTTVTRCMLMSVLGVLSVHTVQLRAGANGPAGQVLAWPLFTRCTPSFS